MHPDVREGVGYKMELANLETQFVVENEFFSVKIAIFIVEMDLGPSITLGAPIYTIPITKN